MPTGVEKALDQGTKEVRLDSIQIYNTWVGNKEYIVVSPLSPVSYNETKFDEGNMGIMKETRRNLAQR
jgi:hypothetical protein